MSNYTKTTDFASKDSLPSGDSAKIVKGAEFETEFDAIATAIATKADTAGPTFTGTVTIPTASVTTFNLGGTEVTATAAELNYVDGVTSAIQTQIDAKAPTASPTFTGTVVADDLLVGVSSSSSGAKIVSKADGTYVAALEARSQGSGGAEWARINLVNEEHDTNPENGGIIYYDQDGILGIRNNNSSGTTQSTRIIAGNTTSGIIQFFDTATSEIARIDSNGLKFNGDSAAANALDDYEEGTFTPYFFGTTTAGVFVYSEQNGYYTKIGRAVHFLIELTATSTTTSPAGNIKLGGLPFTSGAFNGGTASIGYAANFGDTNHPAGANVQANTTQILFRIRQTADARDDILSAVAAASIGGSPQIKMSGVYFV